MNIWWLKESNHWSNVEYYRPNYSLCEQMKNVNIYHEVNTVILFIFKEMFEEFALS